MKSALASRSVRPKTIPLLRCAKGCDSFKRYIFPKIIIKECTKEKKIIF